MTRLIAVESSDEQVRQMLDVIAKTIAHPGGAYGRLCDMEAGRGFKRVSVGDHVPFSVLSSRWFYDTLITLDGTRWEARIVTCRAKRQRHGYFRQLVERITDSGWKPVVLAPIGEDMPAILRHWGWDCEVRSYMGDVSGAIYSEDVWSAP